MVTPTGTLRWVAVIIVSIPLSITPVLAVDRAAYVLADKPTVSSYAPSGDHSYNSLGLLNLVTRRGTGDYLVIFRGMGGQGSVGGLVQVSPYGGSTEACRVASTESSKLDYEVVVKCFNVAGNPADATYMVSMTWPKSPGPQSRAVGQFDVPQTFCANLDSVYPSYACDAQSDFFYQAVSPTERYLSPRNGAVFAQFGSTPPTAQNCAGAPLTNSRISVADLVPSWHVCFRTSSGSLGSLWLREAVGPSPSAMRIHFDLWYEYPSGWPIDRSRICHVPLGACADMDGTLDQVACGVEADLRFQTVGSVLSLVPENGATFARAFMQPEPQIAVEDCAHAALSSSAIDITMVSPTNQTFLCARTSLGRYGYVRVIEIEEVGPRSKTLALNIVRYSQELPLP